MNFKNLAVLLFGWFSLSIVLQALQAGNQVGVPSQPHFVTISFTAAVMQTAEAQREFSALKNHFASRQTGLQALSQDVESLRKLLSDDTVRMTDADRAAKETTLASKEKELQREEEDYRTDSESASQQAFQKVAQKVYSFLEGYAHQHNYSLVVERGTEATPVVWYASEEADITDALVKAYNVIEADSAPGAGSRPGGASAVTASRLRQKESHQP